MNSNLWTAAKLLETHWRPGPPLETGELDLLSACAKADGFSPKDWLCWARQNKPIISVIREVLDVMGEIPPLYWDEPKDEEMVLVVWNDSYCSSKEKAADVLKFAVNKL